MNDMKEQGYIGLSELTEHPENSRTHTTEQIEKIAGSIKELGWGRPIIISKDNYILAGHGAYLAAKSLGYERVPYRRMEHLHDTVEAKAYMIADNRLTDLSEWNDKQLELSLQEIELSPLPFEITGFDEINIEPENVEYEYADEHIPDDEPSYDETIAEDIPTIICPRCNYEIPR